MDFTAFSVQYVVTNLPDVHYVCRSIFGSVAVKDFPRMRVKAD